MSTHHEIPATPESMVLGYFDATLPPVLEVASGDTVTLHSFPAGGRESLHPDPARVPADYRLALDTLAQGPGPHFVTGPVHVRGAEPGDVLQVDILDLRFRMDWGFVAILPLLGTLPDEFTDYETIHPDIDVARGVAVLPWGTELPLDPFFGIMGTAPPAAWGRVGTPVPRGFGGNMDNKELRVGTTLYLPVYNPGAGFYAGDGHGVQGDRLSDRPAALAGPDHIEGLLHGEDACRACLRFRPLRGRRAQEAAPEGGEALYVLVHTPYLRPHHDWSKMFPAYRQVILDKLKRTGNMPDLEERIVVERHLTPQDIHERYKVLNGAIYGLASHGKFMGAFKPGNRSRQVRGLYLAGGAEIG